MTNHIKTQVIQQYHCPNCNQNVAIKMVEMEGTSKPKAMCKVCGNETQKI